MSRSIQDAIKANNVPEVSIRLNMGEDINQCFCPRYQTPLHCAVEVRNQEIVQILLDRGPELNQGDRDGITPLELAIRSNFGDLVSLLKAAGASTSPLPCPLLLEKAVGRPPPWAEERVRSGFPTPILKPKEITETIINSTTKLFSIKQPSWLKKDEINIDKKESTHSSKEAIKELPENNDCTTETISNGTTKSFSMNPESWLKKEESKDVEQEYTNQTKGTSGELAKNDKSTNKTIINATTKMFSLKPPSWLNKNESKENEDQSTTKDNNIEDKSMMPVTTWKKPTWFKKETTKEPLHPHLESKSTSEINSYIPSPSTTTKNQEDQISIGTIPVKCGLEVDTVSVEAITTQTEDNYPAEKPFNYADEVEKVAANVVEQKKTPRTRVKGSGRALEISEPTMMDEFHSRFATMKKRAEENAAKYEKLQGVHPSQEIDLHAKSLKSDVSSLWDHLGSKKQPKTEVSDLISKQLVGKETSIQQESTQKIEGLEKNKMQPMAKNEETNENANIGETTIKNSKEKTMKSLMGLKTSLDQKCKSGLNRIKSKNKSENSSNTSKYEQFKARVERRLSKKTPVQENEELTDQNNSTILKERSGIIMDKLRKPFQRKTKEKQIEDNQATPKFNVQNFKDSVSKNIRKLKLSKKEGDEVVNNSPDEVEKTNDDVHVSNIQRTKQKIIKLFQSTDEEKGKECEETEADGKKSFGFLRIWLRNRRGKKLNLFAFRNSPS